MYGWCEKCKALAIEGKCSEHGRTKPLSFINSIDVRPLTEFEKNFINNKLEDLRLEDGIFLVYGDRYYRRKVIFLDKPLLEFRLLKDGVQIKTFVNGNIDGMEPKNLVNANMDRLNRLIQVSREFSDYEFNENGYPSVISFSGGKDSVVLAHLLRKYNIKRVFIDTRIEFPETYKFIKRLGSVDIAKAEKGFFVLCKEKGFPTYQNRWCCKTQKFEPFNNYLEDRYNGEPVLVYTGQRRWEGLSRLESPFKKPHKHINKQISVQPMLEWLTMDVWNYIWANNLPVNEIYNYFDRGGCWVCPFGLKYRIFILQYTHPKLYNLINKYLPNVCDRKSNTKSPKELKIYKKIANTC